MTRPLAIGLAVCAAIAALGLLGCNEEKRTAWDHGEATREILASQVVNPDASQNDAIPTGLDGHIAARTAKTYQDGEDKDKGGAGGGKGPQLNLNLNTGGSK